MDKKQRLSFLQAMLEDITKLYLTAEVEYRVFESLSLSGIGKEKSQEIMANRGKIKHARDAIIIKIRQIKSVMHDIDSLEV